MASHQATGLSLLVAIAFLCMAVIWPLYRLGLFKGFLEGFWAGLWTAVFYKRQRKESSTAPSGCALALLLAVALVLAVAAGSIAIR